MTLAVFDSDSHLLKPFIELPYHLYRCDKKWVPPLRESLKLDFSEKNPYFRHGYLKHFMWMEGKRTLSRAAAFIDRDLADREGRPVGLLGMFETENDYSCASYVLAGACEWLREQGAQTVLGPVSFSIWNSYRFRTAGHEKKAFYSEPYNPPFYPVFFERFGFRPEKEYGISSANRESMSLLAAKHRGTYEKFLKKGFTFRNFDASSFKDELDLIYNLTVANYEQFPAWTKLDIEEFRYIFKGLQSIYEPRLIYIAFAPDKEAAGLVLGLPDVAEPVRGLSGHAGPVGKLRYLWRRRKVRRVIFSNLSVLEKYRGTGLSNALSHLGHSGTLALGYNEIFYGPSSAGNLSVRHHSGETFARRYTLYRMRI